MIDSKVAISSMAGTADKRSMLHEAKDEVTMIAPGEDDLEEDEEFDDEEDDDDEYDDDDDFFDDDDEDLDDDEEDDEDALEEEEGFAGDSGIMR